MTTPSCGTRANDSSRSTSSTAGTTRGSGSGRGSCSAGTSRSPGDVRSTVSTASVTARVSTWGGLPPFTCAQSTRRDAGPGRRRNAVIDGQLHQCTRVTSAAAISRSSEVGPSPTSHSIPVRRSSRSAIGDAAGSRVSTRCDSSSPRRAACFANATRARTGPVSPRRGSTWATWSGSLTDASVRGDAGSRGAPGAARRGSGPRRPRDARVACPCGARGRGAPSR